MKNIYLAFLVGLAITFGACRPHATSNHTPRRMGQLATTAGTGAATILGCQKPNAQGSQPFSTTLQCEQADDWAALPAGVATTVWTYSMAALDTAHMSVDADVVNVGGLTAADHAQFTIAWGPTNQVDGGIADPTGAGYRTTYSNIGSNLTSTTLTLVQSGASVSLISTCTTVGTYCAIHTSASISVGNNPLAVISVSPSSIASPLATSATVTVTTTPGAAQFVNSATLAGVPFTSGVTPTSDHTAVIVVQPGSYSLSDGGSASGGVGLSSPTTTPLAMPSGFSFTTGGAAPVMGAFLTPDTGPSSGGTVSSIPLTGGACGGGISSVIYSASGYSANATSVSCTGGVATFTSPAFNVTTSSTTDITVTITTTGGSVASSTHLNSFHFLDSTNAWVAMFRGDKLAGGAWSSIASNVGSVTLTAVNSPTTATLNGINMMSFLGTSSQYAHLGASLCTSANITMVAVACAPGALTSGSNTAFGAFSITGNHPQFEIGIDQATGQGFTGDAYTGSALTNSGTIVDATCYRIGGSYNVSTTSFHAVVGSTFATPWVGGTITGTWNDFIIGAYNQNSAFAGYFTGTLAELDVKCTLDSDAVIQTELNAMQLAWSGSTVVD